MELKQKEHVGLIFSYRWEMPTWLYPYRTRRIIARILIIIYAKEFLVSGLNFTLEVNGVTFSPFYSLPLTLPLPLTENFKYNQSPV